MNLRRKILLSFITMSLVAGVICLLVMETAFLRSVQFLPNGTFGFLAPGLVEMAFCILAGITVIAYILYSSIRRLILDPLEEIIIAANRVIEGDQSVALPSSRDDEIGRLCAAFNTMASGLSESRRAMDQRVEENKELLERSQRSTLLIERFQATGRLAALVAQQLNDPMRRLTESLACFTQSGLNPDLQEKHFLQCEQNVTIIKEKVYGMLDLARNLPEVGPVKITQPLTSALDLVQDRMKTQQIGLSVRIDEVENRLDSLRVLADAGDLQHVFINLLDNAIDAMPGGGELKVNASQVYNWVVVEIIDTGVGLSLEELSASFEYFHSSKASGKGAGVGLSIAQHIIAGYKGSLTLNSRKGEGTRASVELPVIGSGGTVRREREAYMSILGQP